jgi:dephospho-CoA kinase
VSAPVIGLVGGIGSGKSTAAAILSRLGARVLNADAIGHEVYRSGTGGHAAVVRAFGADLVGPDGEIDRKRLGAIVFADPGRLAELNRIVHPLIRAEIERRIGVARTEPELAGIVLEAAILIEAGWRDLVDEVWAVCAGRQRVVDRLAAQRGLSPQDTESRIARQMDDAARRAAADVVIENDGSLADLERRVAELWRDRVTARAAERSPR